MGKPWNSRLTALNHWPQRPQNQRGSQTQPRTARDTHLFWGLNFKGYAPSFCGFYIVEYLHFRVLKFSLKYWAKALQPWGDKNPEERWAWHITNVLNKNSLIGKIGEFMSIYGDYWLIPRIISRLVHPSYKWIKPTYPTGKNRDITYLGFVWWATK